MTADGGHYFRVEPGLMKKLFSDQDEIFVFEGMIASVLPENNRIVLNVTKDRIEHEEWTLPTAFEGFRRD